MKDETLKHKKLDPILSIKQYRSRLVNLAQIRPGETNPQPEPCSGKTFRINLSSY